MAPLPIRAQRKKSFAMRIFNSAAHINLALFFVLGTFAPALSPAAADEVSLSLAAPSSGIMTPQGDSKPLISGKSVNELISRGTDLLRSIIKKPQPSKFQKLSDQAKNGNLYAKWRLGRIYADGDGVKRDNSKAYRLLREVAQKHNPSERNLPRTRITIEALVDIANLLRKGVPEIGVRKSPQKAHQILKYVASMYSHPRAQFLLGQMNISGEGTKPQVRQGMRWLNLAARKRNAAAQAALGNYYLSKPKSSKADRAKGLMWLSLARENEKDSKTRQQVSELYKNILGETSTSERERAESLTASWKQRYGKAQPE